MRSNFWTDRRMICARCRSPIGRHRLRKSADYRDIEQRFLDAQAGMLAHTLQEGACCPVCGSTHHPNLAQMPASAPAKAEVEQKKALFTEAEKKK